MKKVYLQPATEVVLTPAFELCSLSSSDIEKKDESGGGTGEGPIIGGDEARITWGNLWAEEEQDFYAYNAWE